MKTEVGFICNIENDNSCYTFRKDTQKYKKFVDHVGMKMKVKRERNLVMEERITRKTMRESKEIAILITD